MIHQFMVVEKMVNRYHAGRQMGQKSTDRKGGGGGGEHRT
jgi:hypothetical protein